MKIVSNQILALLQSKHSNDVFIPECKTGPTQVGSHQRFDAWVMPRSWVNHTTIGYEIKVSRQDFLGDDKWRGYLKYCHEFYFVCPPGIIQPQELDDGIGLLVCSANATRLYRKRKARRRDITISSGIWIYILMARVVVRREYVQETNQFSFWKSWLQRKKDYKNIGYLVSKRLQNLIKKDIYEIDQENKRLKNSIENLEIIKQFCIANKINYNYTSDWQLQNILDRASGLETIKQIRLLEKELKQFRENIEPLLKKGL